MIKPIQKAPLAKSKKKHSDLNLRYEKDPESNKLEISLSDGSTLKNTDKLSLEENTVLIEKLNAASENISGQNNFFLTTEMLSSLSEGICGADTQEKTNTLIDHLHSLSPDDPIEARLQGQFLALQSHGMRAIWRAQNAEMLPRPRML